jgi:hypothetical protein
VDDKSWTAGNRAAWSRMLDECIRQLGYTDMKTAAWIAEREAAIVALRDVCDGHGDNDWDEKLHLADIIEKHLQRHLG